MQLFDARTYLKIDIANNFGLDLDKKDWSERIDWFDNNEHQLEALLKQAETPALYYAGVLAWRDALAGVPSGYPISLDACASGFQLLACLTGDLSAAKACGVVSTGHREDAYTNVFDHMKQSGGANVTIKRNMVKDAVMMSLYGSKAAPREVFGEGPLLDTFYNSIAEVAPYAWNLNQMFLAMWDDTVTTYSWVLPDNFHVHINVMARVEETFHYMEQPYTTAYYENRAVANGRSLSANTVHSLDGMVVRELQRRCNYNPAVISLASYCLNKYGTDTPSECLDMDVDTEMLLTLWDNYKASGYLSARILDYINADNVAYIDKRPVLKLIKTLPAKSFELLCIHDAFRCLPKYGNDIRKQYNLQLALIANSNMLQFLLSAILKKEIVIQKPNPEMWQDILVADYSLS